MVEYCRKLSFFVIWVLFKLIEERIEFQQYYCQNYEKKVREEREMMSWKWEREKRNFGNGIAEIYAQKSPWGLT